MRKKYLVISCTVFTLFISIILWYINVTSPNLHIQTFNRPLYDFNVSNVFNKYNILKNIDSYPKNKIKAKNDYFYEFMIEIQQGDTIVKYIFNDSILLVIQKNIVASINTKTFYKMNEAYYLEMKKKVKDELKRHKSYQHDL